MKLLALLRNPHLLRAGLASGWVVFGRVIGLLWTLLLIAQLGIGDYGVYAMAYAVSAIIAAPVDNIFLVRALRVDDGRFRAERITRALVGGGLFAAGAAVFALSPSAGFALFIAGGEISFNALKSRSLREGHPHVVMRRDAARQAASILVAGGYLVLVPGASLALAMLLYATPYLVVCALALWTARGARPAVPGRAREMGLLWLDAGALAVYLQGDILLLGLLTTEEIAGVFSLASVLALAATTVAQMFVQTYHERLREAGGDPKAGPSARVIAIVALGLGGGTSLLGLVLVVVPNPWAGLGVVLIIMGLFVALHALALILTTILYVQHRDGHRVAAGWTAAAVKLGLVALLAEAGAIGAAVACVVAEIVLVVWYLRVVRAWTPARAAAPDAEPVVFAPPVEPVVAGTPPIPADLDLDPPADAPAPPSERTPQ
ncbi:lipopolysaccharide biosynthesis protein [Microbacterium gilvum]|uniref:Membrane protein involved in the export of O-antigen and teichoic acid n=1 Tax=Microbacterium gilvum TaxID=1336204 RepID=A0ABP9ABB1_9MICO